MVFYSKKDCVNEVLHVLKPRLHLYARVNKKAHFYTWIMAVCVPFFGREII